MKAFLVLSILLFVTAIHGASIKNDDSWSLFKQVHGKKYESMEEESARRMVWEANLAKIRKHNLEADMGLHSYSMGMNVFGDLTHEEFSKQFLGSFKISKRNATAHQTFVAGENFKALPPSVDWRKKGIVTPIKDEGECGASWAFSATGALEGQQAIASGKLISLSEQNLIDCTQPYGNFGCNSGYMDNAFKYVIADGIDTEESYPYEGVVGPCRFNPLTVGAKSTEFVDIISRELDLQAAIAQIGPISIALDASHSSFQLYSSGVYDEPSCSSTQLNFAGIIVGYGTQGKNDYYIFKNIWGTSWGEQGYMLMSRNKKNQCGVATMASYPIVSLVVA